MILPPRFSFHFGNKTLGVVLNANGVITTKDGADADPFEVARVCHEVFAVWSRGLELEYPGCETETPKSVAMFERLLAPKKYVLARCTAEGSRFEVTYLHETGEFVTDRSLALAFDCRRDVDRAAKLAAALHAENDDVTEHDKFVGEDLDDPPHVVHWVVDDTRANAGVPDIDSTKNTAQDLFLGESGFSPDIADAVKIVGLAARTLMQKRIAAAWPEMPIYLQSLNEIEPYFRKPPVSP